MQAITQSLQKVMIEGREGRAGKPAASYSSSSSLSIPTTGVSNGMAGGADLILTINQGLYSAANV